MIIFFSFVMPTSISHQLEWIQEIIVILKKISDLDRSLNHKRERFKVFEVESRSNCDNVIINLIIN